MRSRTTSEVIVVGAGIAGASTAFHLASQGVKTTLLEREHPASGPTGRSSALLHAFYLMPELSQLAHRGVEILRNIPELTGESAGFTEIGTLWAAGPKTAADFEAAVARIQKEGAKIESLRPDELQKMAPDFNWEGVEMAVWEPTCGYADSYSATNALTKGARDRGAKVMLNMRVRRLVAEGGRIAGVETEAGEKIGADIVIAATGVWTKPLIAQVGVDLPLTIERHSMAMVDAPGLARKVMPFCWVDDILMNYGRPDGSNVILLGTWAGGGTAIRHSEQDRGHLVSDPEDYKEGVDTDEAVPIIETFLSRIPEIEKLGVRPGYAGLYDMSPDDNPIIDRVPGTEGLFVVCGSSGHGFKMGPGVGEEVARLVTTGSSKLLTPFRLDRFEEGR